MGKQSFSLWLTSETASAVFAILSLLETRDKLLYVDAPALRNEYMAKIGSFEEEVLEYELTESLLNKKIELIQTAINQRKPIDMDEIESQLQAERSERLSELEKTDKTAKALPSLTADEQTELQTKYRSIIRDFHPQVNTWVTDTQRELYEEAVDAYKRQDIEAIRIIFDMLYDSTAADYRKNTDMEKSAQSDKATAQEISDALASDYSLASLLYECFTETEADAVIKNAGKKYHQKRIEIEEEIKDIQGAFPFNAYETIKNPALTNDYLAELKVRLRQSKENISEQTKKINALLGEDANE